jgi:trans-aconitate 2-methyltransferase
MWNPETYLKFDDQRTRPAIELAHRIPLDNPHLVYDLGCGPGNSTQVLAERWPNALLMGVDNSPQMLNRARSKGPSGATWLERDLTHFLPSDKPDVIYSNATYQWIDGHGALFPKLFEAVKSGGVLAVQMPQNFDAPSHYFLREVAMNGPWKDKVSGAVRKAPVARPQDYYDWLAPMAETIDIWQTEYAQVLVGDSPVLEWVRGTALRPFLDLLEGQELEDFLGLYEAALKKAYPKRPDGTTLFPFKRLFFVAQRP